MFEIAHRNRAIDAGANALSDNASPRNRAFQRCHHVPSHRSVVHLRKERKRGRMDPLQRAEASRWRITLISLFLAGKLVARLADADEELTANYASSR